MKLNFSTLANYPAPVRLTLFIFILLLLWIPFAAPIYYFGTDTNWVSIITLAILYLEFIFLVRFWGKRVYQQSDILRHYGLELSRRNGLDFFKGLAIGLTGLITLFAAESGFGFLTWQPATHLLPVIFEGLLVAAGIGFAEELLFRGWFFDELQRDYNFSTVLWSNSLLFALVHFIKPLADILQSWPQFPGLILLGFTLIFAKQSRRGRLGLPMGIHGGLVWGYYIINVGNLVKYSPQIPDWVIGVNHNPLAGIMGLVFLGGLAGGVWKFANRNQDLS